MFPEPVDEIYNVRQKLFHLVLYVVKENVVEHKLRHWAFGS